MPVKPIRRIAVPTGPSLYDVMDRETLSAPWSREEVARTESQHPDLVVERDGNVVAGLRNGGIAYAFRSERDFIAQFPGMFEDLLPRMRREFGVDTVRFRLTHNPSRPVVEPVLKKLWFSPSRAWLAFSLAKKTPLPKLTAIPGVKFRVGGIDDVDELIRVDREAFPNTPMPSAALRQSIDEGERVLVASVDGRVAGFALYSLRLKGEGYLWVLAVADEHRNRGIGEALTVRVAKKLFAEGAERLDLRTEEDDAAAIRLYVRLGFRQTQAGRDYSRPTDPRAITRIKKTSEGTLIRFGGWR